MTGNQDDKAKIARLERELQALRNKADNLELDKNEPPKRPKPDSSKIILFFVLQLVFAVFAYTVAWIIVSLLT
jgi:hypothetical protein